MVWVVELLDDRVRDELEALPPDMQARFRRIAELIQGYPRTSSCALSWSACSSGKQRRRPGERL